MERKGNSDPQRDDVGRNAAILSVIMIALTVIVIRQIDQEPPSGELRHGTPSQVEGKITVSDCTKPGPYPVLCWEWTSQPAFTIEQCPKSTIDPRIGELGRECYLATSFPTQEQYDTTVVGAIITP